MKNKLRLHYFLVLFFLISNVSAQIGLSVHAGPSFILNNFDSKYSVSAKEVGLNLGLQYKTPLSGKLDIIGNLDYIFNNYTISNLYCERLSINQFPITLGLSLHTTFYEEADFFISALFGGNFMFVPGFSYQPNEDWLLNIGKKITDKPTIDESCCFKFKCGLQIDDTYFFSINYFNQFGGPKSGFDNSFRVRKNIITINLGYGF